MHLFHRRSRPSFPLSTTQIPLQSFPERYLSALRLEQRIAAKQDHLKVLIIRLAASDRALRAYYSRFSRAVTISLGTETSAEAPNITDLEGLAEKAESQSQTPIEQLTPNDQRDLRRRLREHRELENRARKVEGDLQSLKQRLMRVKSKGERTGEGPPGIAQRVRKSSDCSSQGMVVDSSRRDDAERTMHSSGSSGGTHSDAKTTTNEVGRGMYSLRGRPALFRNVKIGLSREKRPPTFDC
jgi:hypothetical protein